MASPSGLAGGSRGRRVVAAKISACASSAMLSPTQAMETALSPFLRPLEGFYEFDDMDGLADYRNRAAGAVEEFVRAARSTLNDDVLAGRLAATFEHPR
ncbi:hypothetical protein [Streptomyces mirabilis]|uniref:hypothetical protein n=1 Tax=Streptomyces mirabilis TaxID=68239 RepID=UPI00369A15F3